MGATNLPSAEVGQDHKANDESMMDQLCLQMKRWMPVGNGSNGQALWQYIRYIGILSKRPNYLRIRLGRLAYDYTEEGCQCSE